MVATISEVTLFFKKWQNTYYSANKQPRTLTSVCVSITMDVFWRHKLKKSVGVKSIQAESEKREESEEWEELWVGYGHYGEKSDAKWGWTS